ncbi:MAG TPA: CoA pyrophosphatase [Burkholderiaceae bacterium]|nr:CoA pyrophosphatase [Burkholderiaceae bacterium]
MSEADTPPPKRAPFDPEAAPVIERGDAREAVTHAMLTATWLRTVFDRPQPWATELTDESRMLASRDPVPAAVLIPIVDRPEGATVLLTRRTAHLNDHAGQISFPGGKVDAGDEDRIATALRETQEEVGLSHRCIHVIGQLPDYLTGTGFMVTPVVALIAPPFSLTPDSFEVAEVFEVPLAFLMNPANHETRMVRWFDDQTEFTRHFFAMPWESSSRSYFIWGATAAMLRNLYRFLYAQQT